MQKLASLVLITLISNSCISIPEGSRNKLELERKYVFNHFSLSVIKNDFLTNSYSTVSSPINFAKNTWLDRWERGLESFGIKFDSTIVANQVLQIEINYSPVVEIGWKDRLWFSGSVISLFLIPYVDRTLVSVKLKNSKGQIIGEKNSVVKRYFEVFLFPVEFFDIFTNRAKNGVDSSEEIESLYLVRQILDENLGTSH